jgi:hypothetical protein
MRCVVAGHGTRRWAMMRRLDGYRSSKLEFDPPLTGELKHFVLSRFDGRMMSWWFDRHTGALIALEVPLLDGFLFHVEVESVRELADTQGDGDV